MHLQVLGNFYFWVRFFFFFLKWRQNTGEDMNAPMGENHSYRLFRLDEMQFVLSKSWWISNTRDICPILDAILLAIGQTFHQTDISFLLMYGLYTAICQSSGKVKDCRVTQKGRGGWRGMEVGRATDKKYQPMSPGLLLIELQPLAARPPEKRTKETLPPPRVHENDANRGGSAQGTPGTVRGDCWPLRAAAFILPPPPGWSSVL